MNALLAADLWIVQSVFQPMADLLAKWRSHYGLSAICTWIGAGCAIFTAACLAMSPLRWIAPLYVFLGWQWVERARFYGRLERAEAAGRAVPGPTVHEAISRLVGILTLIVFLWVSGNGTSPGVAWKIFVVGWALNLCAYYFAACHPGTRSRQQAWA